MSNTIKHMMKEKVHHDLLAATVLRIMTEKHVLEEAEKRACICGATALELNAKAISKEIG